MTDPHPPHEQPVAPADPDAGYYSPPRADIHTPLPRPYEYVSAAGRQDASPAPVTPAASTPSYATPSYATPAYGADRPSYVPSGSASPAYAPPGAPSTYATSAVFASHPGAPIAVPRDQRPRGVAVTGFALAIVGLVLALIPATAGFAILVMLVAFVVSIIGLTGPRGGKGFAGTGLALSILGGLVAVVVAALQAFGAFGSRDLSSPPSSSDDYAQYEPVGSRFAAPGTDGIPDEGVTFATPVELTVTETAFGTEMHGDASWFVVILDNTNSDYIFADAEIRVRALDATGVEVATASEFLTALQGRSAVLLHGVATTGAVASVEVIVPEASYATVSPAAETGQITVTGMQPTVDDRDNGVTVSGEAVGSFAADLWYARVVVVARDGGGRIIGGQVATVDRLPGDGSPAPFNGWFVPPVAADAAFEAYPTP